MIFWVLSDELMVEEIVIWSYWNRIQYPRKSIERSFKTPNLQDLSNNSVHESLTWPKDESDSKTLQHSVKRHNTKVIFNEQASSVQYHGFVGVILFQLLVSLGYIFIRLADNYQLYTLLKYYPNIIYLSFKIFKFPECYFLLFEQYSFEINKSEVRTMSGIHQTVSCGFVVFIAFILLLMIHFYLIKVWRSMERCGLIFTLKNLFWYVTH